MRVIGDLTTNHCGMHHPWFVSAAQGDPVTRGFFTFDASIPHGYASWLGVRSLPKFNFANAELRSRLISDEQSVMRTWLRAPFHLDGWRIDVANMTARQGAYDANHEVAALARDAVHAEGQDKALIAEHFHDAGPDLPGDGWQGAMNYAAFSRPVWAWLRDPDYVQADSSPHTAIPRYGGGQMVASMRSLASRMPWASLLASWNVVDSHDTARVRTVVGSAERQVAALALAVTLPGVPMIFAGDELGARGRWGEDSRTPHPWHAEGDWDRALLAIHRELFWLRRNSVALAEGGLRWIHVADDAVVFVREAVGEQLLVAVAREAVDPITLDAGALGFTRLEHVFGYQAALSADRVQIVVPQAGAGIWRIA
jgi:alpha-glucosidase